MPFESDGCQSIQKTILKWRQTELSNKQSLGKKTAFELGSRGPNSSEPTIPAARNLILPLHQSATLSGHETRTRQPEMPSTDVPSLAAQMVFRLNYTCPSKDSSSATVQQCNSAPVQQYNSTTRAYLSTLSER